jgi:hypothetical protein
MAYRDKERQRAANRKRYLAIKADPVRLEEKRAAFRMWRRLRLSTPEGVAYEQARRQRNKENLKISNLRSNLRNGFGLTLEEYGALLATQGEVCAICGGKDEKVRLAVDHCHETGDIRGLLCRRCNTGLGLFRDSVELMTRAIQYVKDHRGRKVDISSAR